MTAMVYPVVLALLGGAAALTLYRLVRGPSMLDRAIALDVLTAVVMCVIGAAAVARGQYSALPLLPVLTLLGFVGSVSLARFFAGRAR
ncbi:monovalent cation/H+ antiporter complex subunit F [Streptosporangium sandarakinum]|uniref:Multicomponent Na+:H+ antiporter subunit F n=1 Tax=Streptosporangium sandarakinum TaxID=1260955 RepID=A0A852V1C4_9ACTN|nr:monovalent cation/H+ antiporter complex subunit F [Streptosporangium sandarakinum]NYF43562.1 multicomponent Na+:H+ antiporter subunit F [Streptosporangium sandarakinum]